MKSFFLLALVVTLLFVGGRASLNFQVRNAVTLPSFTVWLLINKYLFCNMVLIIIIFLLTGFGTTFRVDRARLEQFLAFGKPWTFHGRSTLSKTPWDNMGWLPQPKQPLWVLVILVICSTIFIVC